MGLACMLKHVQTYTHTGKSTVINGQCRSVRCLQWFKYNLQMQCQQHEERMQVNVCKMVKEHKCVCLCVCVRVRAAKRGREIWREKSRALSFSPSLSSSLALSISFWTSREDGWRSCACAKRASARASSLSFCILDQLSLTSWHTCNLASNSLRNFSFSNLSSDDIHNGQPSDWMLDIWYVTYLALLMYTLLMLGGLEKFCLQRYIRRRHQSGMILWCLVPLLRFNQVVLCCSVFRKGVIGNMFVRLSHSNIWIHPCRKHTYEHIHNEQHKNTHSGAI